MGRCKKGIKPGQSSLSSIILCRMRTGVYRFVALLMVTGIPMLLTACMMGPDYVKPTVTIPETYKEMDGWKLAQPKDEVIRGPWWEVFDDPQLNELEGQVDIANQNIAIAEAQFRQASALVLAARAAYFPLATAGASANRASGSSSLGREGLATPTNVTTTYLLAGNVSWEADIWGRIRRTVESSRASAQASAADLESVRLSVRAALAENYFLLRTLDRQKQLFDATVEAYRRSLELTTNQYSSGVASRADVLQAETQLKSVQAQAIDVGVLRAQYEHAIAVLVGKPPAQFSLPAAPLQAAPPAAPAGIPSELLERRPDIAAAERRMAAANAQIGVAKAAYFPAVTLGAAGGYESIDVSNWLTWPSSFWAVGPAISQIVFDGGLRRAMTDQARAAYDAAVASYRQTVLISFKEVEDNAAALRILEEESRAQDEAVNAARKSLEFSLNQYKQGTVSYLNVITAQAAALNNERAAVSILGRRMTASVLLIKALGGGWERIQY